MRRSARCLTKSGTGSQILRTTITLGSGKQGQYFANIEMKSDILKSSKLIVFGLFSTQNTHQISQIISFFNSYKILTQPTIRIVVTDCEKKIGELASPWTIQQLFRTHPELEKINSDFTKFSVVVRGDLEDKIVIFTNMKEDKRSSHLDRNHARLQLFMINQYIQRLSRQ